jgi:hypothetical protein
MVEPFTSTADQQAMQTVLWSVGKWCAGGIDFEKPQHEIAGNWRKAYTKSGDARGCE